MKNLLTWKCSIWIIKTKNPNDTKKTKIIIYFGYENGLLAKNQSDLLKFGKWGLKPLNKLISGVKFNQNYNEVEKNRQI